MWDELGGYHFTLLLHNEFEASPSFVGRRYESIQINKIAHSLLKSTIVGSISNNDVESSKESFQFREKSYHLTHTQSLIQV